MKIEEITIKEKDYPEQLRNIYDPPNKIYVLGNKEILKQKGIAIVGTRKCSEYGKIVAENIAKQLSIKGINIISGLALGIDTYAHIGNIKAQISEMNYDKDKKIGKTIAVLGSGIDKLYPAENKELAKKIIHTGGCIISEYPMGTRPDKLKFPERNRIISGISNGILVVEAGEKSGALITAEFGLEQGKEIFAVPGEITKIQSKGCNQLIKDGAKIILSYEEILEEIN